MMKQEHEWRKRWGGGRSGGRGTTGKKERVPSRRRKQLCVTATLGASLFCVQDMTGQGHATTAESHGWRRHCFTERSSSFMLRIPNEMPNAKLTFSVDGEDQRLLLKTNLHRDSQAPLISGHLKHLQLLLPETNNAEIAIKVR
eukprot:750430-Hanusia_phi.AAC.3